MQACNFHITTVIVVASYSVTRFSDGANGFLAACAQRSIYGIAITIGWADRLAGGREVTLMSELALLAACLLHAFMRSTQQLLGFLYS